MGTTLLSDADKGRLVAHEHLVTEESRPRKRRSMRCCRMDTARAGDATDGPNAPGWRAMRDIRPRTDTRSIVGETHLPTSRIYRARACAPASDPADRTKGAPLGGGAPRVRSGGQAYRLTTRL